MKRQHTRSGLESRPARRHNLRLDRFEDRLAPAVSVTAGAASIAIVSNSVDDAVVVTETDGMIVVADGSGQVQPFNADGIRLITFRGGAGNDRFENKTAVSSYAWGNSGNDTLIGGGAYDRQYGGAGHDVLVGSAGADLNHGGSGNDLLRRNGYRAVLVDAKAASDRVVGLVNGPLAASELQTKGDPIVSLDGSALTLNSPTGAGFILDANWSRTTVNGQNTFTSSGPVSLKSAVGDIALGSLPLTIVSETSPIAGVGRLQSAVLNNLLPLDTTNVTNPVADAVNKAGVTMTMPGLQYGIATGAQIRQIDPQAPLADGVVYLYAIGQTSSQITYEDFTYDAGLSFTVAFDPSDPAFYLGIDGVPVIERIALGTSVNGHLAYRPDSLPDGMAAPALFGNIYTAATVSVDAAGIPLSLGGEQLIDLDANNDGIGIAVNSASVAYLIGHPAEIGPILAAGIQDVAFGVNGTISASLAGLGIEIGNGSAFYLADGSVAFRGSATNPFLGIGLDWLAPTTAADVQGSFDRSGEWQFQADIANSGLFGLNSHNVHLEGSSEDGGSVMVRAGLSPIPGFGGVQIEGRAYFDGRLFLHGQTTIGRDVTLPNGNRAFGATVTSHLYFNRYAGGAVSISAITLAQLSANVAGFNLSGHLFASYSLSVGSKGNVTAMQGSGSLIGSIRYHGAEIYSGSLASVSVGLGGIAINMPGPVPDLRINW